MKFCTLCNNSHGITDALFSEHTDFVVIMNETGEHDRKQQEYFSFPFLLTWLI